MGIKDTFDKLRGKVTTQGLGSALGTISSLGAMLSPAIGAGLSYKKQLALQYQQQSWLEKMSNTAHQREVKDLVAAGINPLYGLSGGASTPSAGLASAPDFASAASMGTQGRLASSLNKAQIANLESNSRLADFNAVKTGYESDLAYKEVENYDKRFNINMDLIRAQAHAALESGAASSAQASYYKSLRLGQDLANIGAAAQKANEAQYYDWLNKHPFAKWRAYNDRAGVVPGFNFSAGAHGSFSNFSNYGFHK